MPFCPQCGIDNPASARYCDQCGAALIPVASAANAPTVVGAAVPPPFAAPIAAPPPIAAGVVCSQCGAAAIPGEAFCDNCGAPLSAPASALTVLAPQPPYGTGVPAQPVYPPPQPAAPPSYTAPAPQQSAPQQPTAPPIFYPAPEPFPAPPTLQPPTLPPPTFQPPTLPPPTLPPRHLPTLPDPPLSTQPMPAVAPPVAPRAALAPARLVVVATGAVLPLPGSAQAIVGRADAVSKFYPDMDLTPQGALDNGVGRRHLRLFVQGGQIMAEDQDSTNGTVINGQKLAPRQPQPLRDGDTVQLGKLILRFSEF